MFPEDEEPSRSVEEMMRDPSPAEAMRRIAAARAEPGATRADWLWAGGVAVACVGVAWWTDSAVWCLVTIVVGVYVKGLVMP